MILHAYGRLGYGFQMFACFDNIRIFFIFYVIVQSYVKSGFRISDILYFAEKTF